MYPAELFSINETRTRRNIAEYEKKQARLEKAYLAINPNFWRLNLYQRGLIMDFVEGRHTSMTNRFMLMCGIAELTEENLRNLKKEA